VPEVGTLVIYSIPNTKSFMFRKNFIYGLILLVSFSYSCHKDITNKEAQSGSWGDQGDGTFKNPILNGDYPDVDIEQLGDTYYMISSKQHMAPGMVILESKDMVNWRTIGHVWDSLSWAPEYNWDRMNGYAFGVWAGDLAYHEGTWFCYQVDFKHGLYVSTSKDIRGPWSAPINMLPSNLVLDDPAVYWDEESHEAFLICNTAGKQKSPVNKIPGNENRIYKMSWDGTSLLDKGKLLYTGVGAEAARIYKINGEWYVFLAEWEINDASTKPGVANPQNDRKQIVLRSKTESIYGPYDKRVVLEKGTAFGNRSCSQGALMQAPDKSWWYMHQLIQNSDIPFQGRPQCLEPVKWVEGWPIIGIDEDNDGIGEPVLQYKKPIEGYPITAPQTDDDFNFAKLNPQWEWNHNPRNSHWSLTERKGWLRLKAGIPVSEAISKGPAENQWSTNNLSSFPFWRASNTISQRIMGITKSTATAKFDISGMEPGQIAGFVRFGGVYNILGIRVDDAGKRYLVYIDEDAKETVGPEISANDLFIKTSNTVNQAFYEYSLDGKTFKKFGPEFTIKFGNWTGDRLGFFCWNEKEEKGYVDIDWFQYDYDGPKAAKGNTRK
jgi:beta-xylosidase